MLARSPVTTPRVFGSFCRTASAFCALRACNNTWWPFSMSRSAAINPIPSVDPVIKIFFIIKGIRIYGMFAYRCLDDRNYTTINAILMPRAKISRKSTVVDMTAMCDVAFLLLSFFILVARPKPPGALNVITPTSVSSNHMSEKNVVLITIDKDAKVYLSVSEANVSEKKAIIDAINTSKGLHLTDAEMKNFYANPTAYIGVPFAYLKPLLDKNAEQLKAVTCGVSPVRIARITSSWIGWVRLSPPSR